MARGPLPSGNARRRNKPVVEGSSLPRAGRRGAVPKSPLVLGDAGSRWWKWAWKLPQAARWDDGALYFVARRALLEDHAAALDFTDRLDIEDLFSGMEPEQARQVEWALGLLKRSATGEVALMKEMRELENRLGLNPKALAELRWSIADGESDEAPVLASVTPLAIKDPRAS